MLVRTILGALLLWAPACFSEPETTAGESCVDGTPGCDCRTGDVCDAALECVFSIDKCVPLDCTPGANTCTCTDAGGCSGSLVCQGGVCLEPQAGTTGHESGIAESASVETGSGTTTPGSSTGSVDTLSTSETPTTTPVTDTLDGTGLTEVTLTGDSGSEGMPIDCVKCLEAAATGSCEPQHSLCTGTDGVDGCFELQQCVLSGTDTIPACCDAYPSGHVYWNGFALCADGMECMGMCMSTCPV